MGFEFFSKQEPLELIDLLVDGIMLERFGVNEQAEFAKVNEVNEGSDAVFGNPETDVENWHLQSEQMSCAVACQEFIAEQITGKEFNEAEMIDYAEKRGWYSSEGGTTYSDVGKLLEAIGIEVERAENLTLNDLAQALEEDDKIICAVNNRILLNAEYAEIPGQRANHAVEVIGIDAADPNNIEVILNDPGVENGKGLRVDAATFMKAWNTGGNYAAIAKN